MRYAQNWYIDRGLEICTSKTSKGGVMIGKKADPASPTSGTLPATIAAATG